jgi:predicted  nucleic acid-binding Zn-ribbon protein
MKPSKLVKKLKGLLNFEEQKRQRHRDELQQLLKQMKKKEKSLKEKLAAETDPSRRNRLEKEVGILHAQRKKGLKVFKALEAKD